MQTNDRDFPVEYIFEASADAEERLAEAYDLVLALILEELQTKKPDGEECSTPSA